MYYTVLNHITEIYNLYKSSAELHMDFSKFQSNLLLSIQKCKARYSKPILIFNDSRQLAGFCICSFDDSIQFTQGRSAFFFNIMMHNDHDVIKKMIRHFRDFMAETNVSKIVGPIHESIVFSRGVKTFDSELLFTGLPYNKSYLNCILSEHGFQKEQDLVEVIFPVFNPSEEKIILEKRLAQRFQHINFETVNGEVIQNRSSEIVKLYNSEWRNNWGFYPIDEDDVRIFCQVIPSYNNHAVFSYFNDELVGFCMMFEEVFSSLTGARVYFIGVSNNLQKSGLSVYMLFLILEVIKRKNIKIIGCAWMLESNLNIIKFVSSILPSDIIQERRYRIFSYVV